MKQLKQLETAASLNKLKCELTGHVAAHIDRVRLLAVNIATQEGSLLTSVMNSCEIIYQDVERRIRPYR
ncbi:hypothetical protein WAX46_00280 [Bacillus sp. FJAT-53060]|uniref:hypothetical protein n=1 Tax=Bacillus TaxID=1386 RepID=UPI001CFBBC10|nr:hypothetical protein [Bacillus stratosphericus]